jgi:hypothetical protein
MRNRRFPLMTALVIGLVASGPGLAQQVTNLVADLNPGFESGQRTPWGFNGGGVGTATVVRECLGAAVPEGPIEGSYCLNVQLVGPSSPNWWNASFSLNYPAPFEKGKKYTLSLWVKSKSDTARINFKPEHGADPYTGYGETQITATDKWAEYHVTTPVFAEDVTPASLTFHIGFAAQEFWVDDCKFYEGDYVPTPARSAKGALAPTPDNEAVDVPRDLTLNWKAGPFAATHNVYLDTSFDDVNDAAPGQAVSQGQTGTTFQPADLLEFGRTYYWRVDEANAPPSSTVIKGNVWSFTVEPYAYPITAVTATASSAQVGMGPEKTIDGSGLTGDLHGTEPTSMWLSAGAGPNWIQYEFDQVYTLHEMQVWNSNQLVESFLGFGARKVTVGTSLDGTVWTPLADTPEFSQAPGAPDYAANTTVSLGGVQARYVKLTIDSTWGGLTPQSGLSEVRFLYVPVQARLPQPADAATGVGLEAVLDWRPGREATSHTVSLSTDRRAVADGTATARTVTDHRYTPDSLNLATTYYWKVDEVGAATYPGEVWSFTTQDYRVVDDFESYTDKAGEEVFTTWVDGFDNPAQNGAVVGLATAVNGTFCDTTTFYEGRQSMPLAYDNTTAPLSETARTFDTPQDWSRYGINALVLYLYGDPANAAGRMYLKINGTKVIYSGNANALQSAYWTPWSIDLAATGANLKAVTKLTVGVESSGSGLVYVDEIRLYRSAPVLLEAEAGTITAPMKTYDDPLALGGKYIGTDEGIGDENNNPPADGVATYRFTVPGGVYKILLRVSIANASNSFWVRIPDATSYSPGTHPSGWIRFNDIEDGIAWHWDEVHSSDHNNQVVQVTLPAGAHTLEIARREDGAKVDAIMILPVGQ